MAFHSIDLCFRLTCLVINSSVYGVHRPMQATLINTGRRGR